MKITEVKNNASTNLTTIDECWFIDASTNTVGQILPFGRRAYAVLSFQAADGTPLFMDQRKANVYEDEFASEDGFRIFKPLSDETLSVGILANDFTNFIPIDKMEDFFAGKISIIELTRIATKRNKN